MGRQPPVATTIVDAGADQMTEDTEDYIVEALTLLRQISQSAQSIAQSLVRVASSGPPSPAAYTPGPSGRSE